MKCKLVSKRKSKEFPSGLAKRSLGPAALQHPPMQQKLPRQKTLNITGSGPAVGSSEVPIHKLIGLPKIIRLNHVFNSENNEKETFRNVHTTARQSTTKNILSAGRKNPQLLKHPAPEYPSN